MFLEVAPEVKRGLHSGAGRCAARVLPWPGGRPVLAFPEGSVPPALHRGWLESVPTAPRGPAAVCPHRVSLCAQRGVGGVTRKSGSFSGRVLAPPRRHASARPSAEDEPRAQCARALRVRLWSACPCAALCAASVRAVWQRACPGSV